MDRITESLKKFESFAEFVISEGLCWDMNDVRSYANSCIETLGEGFAEDIRDRNKQGFVKEYMK